MLGMTQKGKSFSSKWGQLGQSIPHLIADRFIADRTFADCLLADRSIADTFKS